MTKSVVAPVETSVAAASKAGKYLTFQLGRESYGFPVLKVREIIRYITPTLMPQLPPHVRGVINLRGKIVPVVDLRLKLGMPADIESSSVCIIVVQITSSSGSPLVMGMIVDAVEEVIQISGNEIEKAPDFGNGSDTGYILGMAKVRGKVKTLIDIDQTFTAESLESIGDTAAIAKI